MPVKSRKPKLEKIEEKLISEQVETTFGGETLRRMRKYMRDHALLKEQEIIRLSVGFFLQKQGY